MCPPLIEIADENILRIQIEVDYTKSASIVRCLWYGLLKVYPGRSLADAPVLSTPEPKVTPGWEFHRDTRPYETVEDSEQLAIRDLDSFPHTFGNQRPHVAMLHELHEQYTGILVQPPQPLQASVACGWQ